jgi:putative oxidoreductase
MKKEIFVDFFIAILIILFTYTAFSKLFEQNLFVSQMQRAPVLLMKIFAPVLGWLLPATELVIVAGLMIDRFQIKALKVAFILFALFEFYIVLMLISGLHLPCSCGGVIGKMTWKQHVPFNLFFMIASLYSIHLKGQEKNIAIS